MKTTDLIFSYVVMEGGSRVSSIPAPEVGAVAVAGLRRQMEDSVTVKINLCTPVVNGFRPVHYFGVYDGHGGPHFSIMCKDRMHGILREELNRAGAGGVPGGESVLQETWRQALNRCFARTETMALRSCSCGYTDFQCGCYEKPTDYAGTTAVVVVLTDNHIVVGNCGDSRAVLYRGGRIIPLSFDHKPNRADEKLRIEAVGGHVIHADIPRVQGILAMSRAIGDRILKPYVISEPEVTFTRRDRADEFLIVASDGVWNAMPTEMACSVVRGCLWDTGGGAAAESGELPSRSATAATLLSRLAFARTNGNDDVAAVVVNLKQTAVSV